MELFSSSQEISKFCTQANLEVEDLFQATWAIVLRSYIGADQVSFAVGKCGHNVADAFPSLLICRSQLGRDDDVIRILRQMQENRAQCSPHAFSSFEDIPGLEEQALCNSMVLLEEVGPGQFLYQKAPGRARRELVNQVS